MTCPQIFVGHHRATRKAINIFFRGSSHLGIVQCRVNFFGTVNEKAQLGGVHLACEQASNLLTKVLEWGRLMAYLEKQFHQLLGK